MARNAAGNYSLPSGNPVVSGATIQSSWANTTLADLATEITDSLSRTGKGAMLAPLLLVNGSAGAPAIAFATELSSGFFRNGSGDWRVVAGGADRIRLRSAGAAASPIDFISNQAGAGTFADFYFETLNTRTSGALFQLRNNGVERFRIDFNGDIYKNGSLIVTTPPSVNLPWTSFFVANDATVTATASDLTGMSFAMEANSKYIIRGELVGLSGDGAAYGVTFRMKGSGAPTINSMRITTYLDPSGGAVQTEEVTAVDTDFWTGTVDVGQGGVRTFSGVINTGGSAGTFQLQGRRNGGTADPAIRAGSYIEYHKV